MHGAHPVEDAVRKQRMKGQEMNFKQFLALIAGLVISSTAAAQGKPNILVIGGDDIGQSNISAYTFGLVGYRTPNIDRTPKKG